VIPDPHESLSIFAEISIALCGFSGIVIAFGSRSLEALTALERRRLANLFMLSGCVLIVSLFAISLRHAARIPPDIFWSPGCGLILFLGTIFLLLVQMHIQVR
jgi:hypothetical protein